MFLIFTFSRAPVLWRIGIVALCAGLPVFGPSLHAAAASKTSFDLPADTLETSMKRFATQSGWEVLLPGEGLDRVRTTAVRGEMTSRQALDAMLVGTGLTVLQDTRTGAFTVRRKDSRPKGGRAAQRMESDRPERQTNSNRIHSLQHP